MTPEEPGQLILSTSIREAAAPAIRQNRKDRRRFKKQGRFDGVTASGIIVPDPLPSQLHYHVIYHVPAEGVSIPHWKMCFLTPNAVREHIAELGQKAEPNTEWYEDGQVGIETSLHGRTGLWWVILQAAGCDRSTCAPSVKREQTKRALILMPGKKRS